MKTTAEMKIEISNARISNAKAIAMPDGTCKLKLELEIARQEENDYLLVEASKLSLANAFMSHEPRTKEEKEFKDTLSQVIKNGIADFYRPIMDPSFLDEAKTKIHYRAGERPATEYSYNRWKEILKDSEWCFGTKAQYVAFLGVLIKILVDKGWKISEAWDAVCNDSKKLGHYWNSENAKHKQENTGSREICGFFDLANTYKILAEDEEEDGFWLGGGTYGDSSFCNPLADLALNNDYCCRNLESVVWLVKK